MVSLKAETKAVLDNILNKAIEEGRVPGAVFAAASIDQELYSGAAGHKGLQGSSPCGEIDEKSVFWICSMTKLVVTIALLQLVERGKLTLETPVADIVPELANPVVVSFTDKLLGNLVYKPATKPILVRHLLNHSSGLTYVEKRGPNPDALPLAYTQAAYEGDHSVKRFFELINGGYPSVPLLFEPGSEITYGWNCDVMVFIVERLTGKGIEEYCKEFIFGPLEMESTFYLTPSVKKDLVSLTYRRKDGKLEEWADQLPIIEQDPAQMKICLGGIGIYSTMKDYLNMIQHLLQLQWGITGKGLLSTETVKEMFKPTMPPEATKSIEQFTGWENVRFGWALCLNQDDWPGRRRRGSGFWYGWAGTYFFMDPTTGIAVVYGAQVVPISDSEVVKLFGELEEALYKGIVA